MLISNDYELEMVMKMTGMNKKELLRLTKTIITTLGERLFNQHRRVRFHNPSGKVNAVVDPTGAGDAFRAGLLKGIAMGKDLEAGAKMGAVAAVYAIEKYGTQEHYFSYDDFSQRYRSNFGEMVKL